MSQSLSNVILHVVFSTKDRRPLIDLEIEEQLYAYIASVIKGLGSFAIIINGCSDHIHLLLSLGRTVTISKLISDVKSNSSRWIKTKGSQYSDFAWQRGYGVFSVSEINKEPAIQYISNQKEHHKKVSYQDEYRKFLKSYSIKFDEKYVWD